MGIYKDMMGELLSANKYIGWYYSGEDIVVESPLVIQKTNNTRGNRIIQSYRNQQSYSFPVYFGHFNTKMAGENWTWNPNKSVNTSNILGFLDGELNDGECAILAGALLALWKFPSPLGLGQNGGKLSKYEGGKGEGFISKHQASGVFNLKSNIVKPHLEHDVIAKKDNAKSIFIEYCNDQSNLMPLRRWGDHKTVLYGGKYYDPSYSLIYQTEEKMQLLENQPYGDNFGIKAIAKKAEANNLYSISKGSTYYFPRVVQLFSGPFEQEMESVLPW